MRKALPQQWTFFHLSKIYSDGKNLQCCNSEEWTWTLLKKTFNVLQTRTCSHEIKSVRRCRNKVVCRCNMFFLVFKIICNPRCVPDLPCLVLAMWCTCIINVKFAFVFSQSIFLIYGIMLERWIIISGAAFSPFLYFVFVAMIEVIQ